MKPPAICLIVVFVAAVLLAGCGGGGSSSGSSTAVPGPVARDARGPAAVPGPGAGDAGGPAAKAIAPQEPAGSKVVSCGGGGAGVSGLRASATDCGAARAAMRGWRRHPACRLAPGASRSSCSLGAYRCQAIDVERGTAVSCARPDGSDVSFVSRRR